MAKSIAHFTIAPNGEGYSIQIEDDDGDTTEFSASYEQLDLIAEAIDNQLDSDSEEFEEVEDGAPDEEA